MRECIVGLCYILYDFKQAINLLLVSNVLQVLQELGYIIGAEKAQSATENAKKALRALLKNPQDLSNSDTVDAIAIVEKRTKKKGQGKLITFHDVSIVNMNLYLV